MLLIVYYRLRDYAWLSISDPFVSSINILTTIPFQLLERVLLECGNDIDTATKSLQELCLGAVDARGENLCSVEELHRTAEQGMTLPPAIVIYSNFALPSLL